MYRMDVLLKASQKMFHTADLAVIWGVTGKNTLYTAIKRYVQKGVLIPIQKGFYSVVPLGDLDPYALGVGVVHRYAYVSTETILAREGKISQNVYPITLVSSVSKKFKIDNVSYVCRKMRDDLLYKTDGLEEKNGVLYANSKRARQDMLYFNPRYYFDRKR